MVLFKSILFLMVVPGAVAGYIPLALLRKGPHIETGIVAYFAFPLWSVGGLILLCSFWNFVSEGHGTPAPIDPPRELVLSGFYRYTRNPMYVGVISILVGYFLWFGFWLLLAYAGAAFVATHSFVTLYEEPHLKKKFGLAYEDYLLSVPRWISRVKAADHSKNRQ